jgi:multimeric flavodoxin WrbA
MKAILAIYASPRRGGNTATLLREAIRGAREAGGEVDELVLRDLRMSPCLEIYECRKSGRCALQDDFQRVQDQLLGCRALMFASPIFFYAVSAHAKILIDRCQSLWVKKYWIDRIPFGKGEIKRKGLFLSVGATRGPKLFDGALQTVRYFFDTLDMELWRSLTFRGLDFEGDVLKHPEYLEEAYRAGRQLYEAIDTGK